MEHEVPFYIIVVHIVDDKTQGAEASVVYECGGSHEIVVGEFLGILWCIYVFCEFFLKNFLEWHIEIKFRSDVETFGDGNDRLHSDSKEIVGPVVGEQQGLGVHYGSECWSVEYAR